MLYAYKCPKCNHEEEISKPLADMNKEEKCEKCQAVTERQIVAPGGIHFKGRGFYATDYKRKN
jgi:putative FmdB family regulatory protein